MKITKVLILLLVLAAVGCSGPASQDGTHGEPPPSPIQQNAAPTLQLKMDRSACFGPCPVYSLVIDPDGKVVFNGLQDTKTKGKAEDSISWEKTQLLIDEIRNANFFSLKDSYGTSSGDGFNCPGGAVTDSPTVKLYIKLDGKEKTIAHYLGCKDAGEHPDELPKVFPKELYNLENKIDEIVGTSRWTGKNN